MHHMQHLLRKCQTYAESLIGYMKQWLMPTPASQEQVTKVTNTIQLNELVPIIAESSL